SLPTAQVIPNILPSGGLTTNDINLVTTDMTMNPHPAGAASTVTNTPTGIRIDYATGTGDNAWSAGSYAYDNLGTINVMESYSLYGYNNIVIGLNGNPSQVKMEVEDINGAKASVYLKGVTSTEQIWSVPVTLLSGIDLGRVRFITFVVEGDSLSGTVYAHTLVGQAVPVNVASNPSLSANDINIATTSMMQSLNSEGATATVSNIATGVKLDYNTGTNASAWAAALLSYDNILTTNAVETFDLAQAGVLKIGVKGDSDTVKLEFQDIYGNKAAVNLTGVDPVTEKIWAIDPGFLTGIDLSRIRNINVVVEGQNKTGTVYVHTIANSQIAPNIPVADGLTASDINLPATYTMELPRATITKNAAGISMTYNTGADGWAGGGFSYDNFGTPPVETRTLGGNLVLGLKGPISKVKMEIEDSSGNKGIAYLEGIDAVTEKYWSVPTSYFPNVDLNNVRFVLFIIEGNNQSGTLNVHVLPDAGYGYAMNAAPGVGETMLALSSDRTGTANYAALLPILGLFSKASRKKKTAEEEKVKRVEKAAILDMQKVPYMAFSEPVRVPGANIAEEISEVLWQAAQGEITSDEARSDLEKLAPNAADTEIGRKELYDNWLDAARVILLGLGLSPVGKYKAPSALDIKAIAEKVKYNGIEIYIPSSQLPGDSMKKFKTPLERIFGDKLRTYQKIEDLQAMIKDPAKAVVMTVDLTETDINTLDKMKIDLRAARFMNFEAADISAMSRDEHENYIAETLSMLVMARTLTEKDAKDKGSAIYQMLAHLLESHMDEAADVDAYIANIADSSMSPIAKMRYMIKAILKAVPVAAYKLMKPAVEVLWSA
ncbi:MAG: hypothetical protein JXB40_04390, partial [Candidatus Omnitrophica bacterium]|nr:hypothetical protein [Candidatus Omnitrophota bacterium]